MSKTHTRFTRYLFALALVASTVACDPADDPDGTATDSGGDTDGDNPNDGDGQFVRCCFFASNDDNDGREVCVPQNSPYHACVDPDSGVIDTNGSGNVDASEFAGFCQQKVPDDISVLNPWAFPFLPPDEMSLLDINGPWISASAIGGSLFGSCVPNLDPTVNYPGSVVAPTHEGTFTSAKSQSSSVDVQIGGVHRLVAAGGQFELAIFDCQSSGHLETCSLELRSMKLDIEGPASFADYSIDTAVLSTQGVGMAAVTFDCSDGSRCLGSFDFSTRNGTSLDALLEWDQTNLSTGSLGGGSLRLGENGLGKMSRVLGELDLDKSKKVGTLRIRGGGSDRFGGTFANIGFDVAGPVEPYAVP